MNLKLETKFTDMEKRVCEHLNNRMQEPFLTIQELCSYWDAKLLVMFGEAYLKQRW